MIPDLDTLLLEKGGIASNELQQARTAVEEKDISLARALITQKAIPEKDLLELLANYFRLDLHLALPQGNYTAFTATLPIGFLKKNLLVPVRIEGELCLALNDPFDYQTVDEVRKILEIPGCRLVLSPESEIIRTINSAYDLTQGSAEQVIRDIDEEDADLLFSRIEEVEDLLDDTSDSPVIRLVNLMLSQAVRGNISDIHIEPQQASLKIRQRLDGVLYDMFTPPKHVQPALISRIKLMARMNIAEKRLPQDGRIEIKVGNKDIDIRVSTLPTAFGERVVLRLLDKSTIRLSLTELGMAPELLEHFTKMIRSPNGIVLVTGPTGSGKTTTLYAALSEINTTDINIITVEDPIEYRIPGVGQMQVNPKINLTFASGLRSIVRQDPDVILIGEIRDLETAEIAIQSALTGHLVFSTLHTNDAPSTITRLRDMGVEPFLIGSSVSGILAQRLVRVICDSCKEPYSPAKEELDQIGLDANQVQGMTLYRGRGCDRCLNTGYHGRTGIHEFLLLDEEMKKMVLKTSDATLLRSQALSQGMKTLLEDGADKIAAGVTTVEEVYRIAQN